MKYIEAPQYYQGDPKKTLFLAGGITGCPDWQSTMTSLLDEIDITILNPRRKDFPIDDPGASKEQINWEHVHLRKTETILFWFPKESICPIALYELGAWCMTDKSLFVGVHPEYPRRQDVELQTSFVRPDINITYSIEKLANQIIDHLG